MQDTLILVDENDTPMGEEEKLSAHKAGKLHRGLSVLVFNAKGELMLQKRAKGKYHSGGLWSNTCCSHPRPSEDTKAAAHRRLREEMGFDCGLEEVHQFVYKVPLDNGITEHEYLHVFVGRYGGQPTINPEEAEDWKWTTPEELRREIGKNPDKYTYWFKTFLEEVLEKSKNAR